jgi:hypothetical protein
MKLLPIAVMMVALSSIAQAVQVRVELSGKARLERPNGTVQEIKPGNSIFDLQLEPGDRLCLSEGTARVISGVRGYSLGANANPCFAVARPHSYWSTLSQTCKDIGACRKEAEKLMAVNASSKGNPEGRASLLIPTNYSLPLLHLPIAQGRLLRLFDNRDQLVYIEEAWSNAVFLIPVSRLKQAKRLEVRSAAQALVYAASVQWIELDLEFSSELRDQGLQILTAQQPGLLPVVFSYLQVAGETELAPTLKGLISP